MEVTIRRSSKFLDKYGIWNKGAWIVWTTALVVLSLRPILLSHRGTSFDTYQLAGSNWLHGENVYAQWMGFVYSPLVAAFFVPFAWIPVSLANILWRVLNTAVLLGGLAALLKTNLFAGIKERSYGIPYLLLVPLAIGNIDISQANPLVEGLLLFAIAAVCAERWNSAALCIAIATYFKIYPIAAGLLLCVIAPKRFSWRMVIALLLLLLLPFVLQHWSYVSSQYHSWIATRTSDDRRQWPVEKLPLDLWFLIHWVWHLPIAPKIYSLIQLGTAAALALFCAVQTWRGWAKNRILIGLFCLVSIWMTLCGPATESYTYLILAPAIILAAVQAFATCQPALLRTLISAALVLQLLAATRASFLPHFKPFWALSILPSSALLFLAYALLWLFDNTLWPEVIVKPNPMRQFNEAKLHRLLSVMVIGLWAAVLLGVWIRVGLYSHSHDVFGTYADAGRKWTASQPLYSYTRGFVYSPLVAAFFAPFSWLPTSLGSVLWRMLNVAMFVAAIFWWLRAEITRHVPESSYWLVFLLILPLSLGNFNNGQVNPMIIGLLMVALLAAHEERWTLSAVAVGFAAYLKIYPLSVGLLLVLLYPRQLGWRLALTLILMGAVSFVLQRPTYVLEQYQRWFSTRVADDRRMNMDISPRDFAMILRLLHIHLSAQAVLALQMLAGAGAAAICVVGRLRKWSEERLLVCVFTTGTCWMLLFGPTTEDATYAMIAPALAFAIVQALHQKTPLSMRVLVCASFALLLLGLVLNAFFGLKKTPASMSVQPFGALLFASYSVLWVIRSSLWKERQA